MIRVIAWAIIGVAGAALLIRPAAAGTPTEGNQLALALCKHIQSDAERLKCYDGIGTTQPLAAHKLTENPAFRGINLNITLSEFRRTPFPDSAKYPNSKVLCSGDKEVAKSSMEIHISKTFKRVGVVACRFFSPAEKRFGGGYWQNAPDFAGIGGYETTFFFSPPAFEEPFKSRLYQISVEIPSDKFGAALNALTVRYGEPTNLIQQTLQTQIGATFNNEIALWQAPNVGITITRYTDTIKRSSILYLHNPTFDKVDAVIRDLAKEDASKL